MFQLANPLHSRRLVLGAALGALLVSAAVGGVIGYLVRCDRRDYLDRVAVSPLNSDDQYLFACGHVWRSLNGGRDWGRVTAQGLPVGMRDGHIAVDRQSGYVYLGLMINGRAAPYCLPCLWTQRRPAIYTSTDGGRQWSLTYKFSRRSAGYGIFLDVLADPDHAGTAWAVVQYGGEVTYYSSDQSGQVWKQVCSERYSPSPGGCELPENILQFRTK